MEDTQKKVLIVVAILVVVGVAGYFLLSNQKVQEALETPGQDQQPSEQMEEEMGNQAAEETQNLIDEATQKAQENQQNENVVTIQKGEGTSTATTTAVRVAEGGSPISTESGQVVTEEGENADESATPGTPDAPSQSFATNEDDLPESTIKMKITPDNIDPAEFTVAPGQAVSISVTAAGDATEIFRFKKESLQGVAVGVAPGKTRVTAFNAPEEPGEYVYYSDVANHEARGAKGTMIVEE